MEINEGNLLKVSERISIGLLKASTTLSKDEMITSLLRPIRHLISVSDVNGNTAVNLSVIHKNYSFLKCLIDTINTIPSENIINRPNKQGFTPLINSCYLDDIEMFNLLLDNGADVTSKTNKEDNILHIACKYNNLRILKSIRSYLDSHKLENADNFFNGYNSDNLTPIHLTVFHGSKEALEEILEWPEIDVNVKNKDINYTPLHYASLVASKSSLVKIILNNPKVDVNAKSKNNIMPIHLAVLNKNYFITIALIRKDADLESKANIRMNSDYKLTEHTILLQSLIKEILDNKDHPMTPEDLRNYSNVIFSKITKMMTDVDKPDVDSESQSYQMIAPWNAIDCSKGDPWMEELLNIKNQETIKRTLFERILCFENVKEMVL